MALFKRRSTEPADPQAQLDENQIEPAPVDRPRDRAEVSSIEGMIDLGSMCIPPKPGMELRLEADQAQQVIVGVTVVMGEAVGQFQAFAAPRSFGLWDEIREEILEGITTAGGSAEEVDGEFGPELEAKMPGRGTDGRVTYQPARFVGADGPRWFVRLVISGKGAVEASVARPLLDLMREIVIVRGDEARAPRELLPLSLPKETPQMQRKAEVEDEAGPAADDLKPFERGPEITEIR